MLAQCLFLRTETMLELILFVLSPRKRNYLPNFVNQITFAHRWFRFTREKKKNLVTLFKAIQKSTAHSPLWAHLSLYASPNSIYRIKYRFPIRAYQIIPSEFRFCFHFFVPEENSSRWLCFNDSLHVLHI